MPTALEVLHAVTPCVLLLPVLTLVPAPRPTSIELPGVRAVTIKTVTPRRSFILLTLGLLALTSALEAALLAIDLVATPLRKEPHTHSAWYVASSAAHSLGGLCVYALAAILAEWRTRWGDRSLVVLSFLAFGLEVPNLILSIIREVHTDGTERIVAILELPLSALRLLLLPVLVCLVFYPVVRFERADERTGLLAEDQEETPARQLPANGYGTFDDGNSDTSRPPRTAAGTPQPPSGGPDGMATPSGIQKTVKIPKKLGEKQDETQGISWRAFWSRIWKLRGHLWPSTSLRLQLCCLACVLLLIIGLGVNAMVPYMLGKFVDALTATADGQPGESPWPWFGFWICLRAVQGGALLNFLQNMLWVPVQQYADREMQMLLFNHLLDLSLAFHTKRNTGEVLKIIDRGSAINNLLQVLLFSATPTILNIIVTFCLFLGLYSGALAMVLSVVMITYVTFSIVFTSYRTKLRRQMVERDIKTRGIASDVLTNWESVKYFTAEQRESTRFKDSIIAYQETEYKVMFSFNLLNMIQAWITTIGLLSGSLIIAYRVLHGTAKVGAFVSFLQYLQQLYGPLDRLGTLYRQLNTQSTDAEKLFNLLAQPTEIKDDPGAKDLVVTDGIIEFDNVNFSYDGQVQALKGVSFRIGKGESMALVGESGSGKSTILRLLYRFYDINSGHIYIDGQDISKVTQRSLRHAIGIVPQDSVLWNDTIGANIAYGKEGAGDDQIIAAARAAKLHERILTFSEGYSTIVGERGVRLSGGEKQRVSLARMFLKSPAILVLDEATSALDTETEREIQRSLAELAQNRSSLSIAHRLSTIINSDQIVVMKDGSVLEHGTYHELIEQGGQFAAMWKKQIFTEAEMLADAQSNASQAATAAAAAITEGKDEDEAKEAAVEVEEERLIQIEDVHIHRVSPPSTVQEGDDEVASSHKSLSHKSSSIKAPSGTSPSNKSPKIPSVHIDSPDAQSPLQPGSPAKDASEREGTPTPSKPASSFPGLEPVSPPMTRSPSQQSNRHSSDGSEFLSSTSTPAAGSSVPKSDQGDKGGKGEKRRKRLSSIKGFVRRMSEERRPLSRNNSTGGASSGSRASEDGKK